jgi:hypothetical protein
VPVSVPVNVVVRQLPNGRSAVNLCAAPEWDSNPHEVPSPDFESALLKDRGRHRGTQGDKTALL